MNHHLAKQSSDRSICISLLIGLLCLVIYNVNLRSISTGDNYPARYLPLSLWKHASLTLDPIADLVAQGIELPTKSGEIAHAGWVVKSPNGHLISLYPIATPVLVSPLYLPAIAYLNHVGWSPEQIDFVARFMEKLVASLIAAVSVALLYLVLLRQCSNRAAVMLSLAYGLGTSTWVISSQALWMHGLAQLLVTCGLWLATRDHSTPRNALALGLVCGLLASNRQPDTILAMGFAAYALVWARGNYGYFLAGALPPALLSLAYNLVFAGSYLGGYAVYVNAGETAASWQGIPEGLAGLLFSPVQGLFVFSPFLLFLPLCFRRVIGGSQWRLLAKLLSVAVLVQIVFYAAAHWTQGVSWGARFMTDMLPILIWLLPPALKALSKTGRAVFAGAVILSVAFEAIGAFGYTGEAHSTYLANQPSRNVSEVHAASKRSVWLPQNSPLLNPPRLLNDLGTVLRGSIDKVSVNGNGDVVVEGWALSSNSTPHDLHVLVDGQLRVASTDRFHLREDVARYAGVSAASGWIVSFPRGSLAAGKHVFTALVRAQEGAQPRVLPNFEFEIEKAPSFTVLNPALSGLKGSIDVVNLNAGTTVDVAGWTLADGRMPLEVALVTDAGRVLASTRDFFMRIDVAQALGVAEAGGWRMTFPATALGAGKHQLGVLVTSVSGSSARLTSTAQFDAPSQGPSPPGNDESLAAMAAFVTRMLEHRQQSDGYWLTEHTKSAKFQGQSPELNLFANAQIIDMLAPVSEPADAVKMLDRARRFLGAQIESTGLVRYHGNPNLSTHGTLSCRITPDADDTALAWRIAPTADRRLADKAFATLREYRTSDGLYRTWLAPQDRYECIDPGADPNPVDIGIQINVLLWLHAFHPPAAKELCTALQSRSADPRLWVYYQKAPAVVLLHLNELQRVGCPLNLPEERLKSTIHKQEVWLDAIQRIQALKASPTSVAERSANEQFLRSLARDGFAAVTTDPVLFYHNDLTASVSRYYWSHELAYALWLRLYFDNLSASAPAPTR